LENITLAEFHQMTGGLQLIGITTRHDTLQPVELSAETHPTMTLLQAIHATCSIPLVFQPCVWTAGSGTETLVGSKEKGDGEKGDGENREKGEKGEEESQEKTKEENTTDTGDTDVRDVEIKDSPMMYLDGGLCEAYPLQYRRSTLGDDCSIFGFCVQHVETANASNAGRTLFSFAAQLIRTVLFHRQPIAHYSSPDTFYIPIDSTKSELESLRSFELRKQMVHDGKENWMRYMAQQRALLGVSTNSE
jgi:predicted acylesterase/phospholipase RssA